MSKDSSKGNGGRIEIHIIIPLNKKTLRLLIALIAIATTAVGVAQMFGESHMLLIMDCIALD